jgi:hypothetical protein
VDDTLQPDFCAFNGDVLLVRPSPMHNPLLESALVGHRGPPPAVKYKQPGDYFSSTSMSTLAPWVIVLYTGENSANLFSRSKFSASVFTLNFMRIFV